jgi:hypothetical protein
VTYKASYPLQSNIKVFIIYQNWGNSALKTRDKNLWGENL